MHEQAPPHDRTAKHPREIPWRGWCEIALRVKDSLSRDNVSLMSAGLAMYGLLAIFPALSATVSLYGLLVTPTTVVKQISAFSNQMPPGVWDLLKSQLQDVAAHQHEALTISAVIALLVALWSASSGMSSLMTVTNVAYGEPEQRGFIAQTALAALLAVGSLVGFVFMLALTFAVPLVLGMLGTSPWLQMLAAVARWLLLWCFAVLALAIIYRLAPARAAPRWHWVTRGSIVAATLWLASTALFTLYVRRFASYQKTYGALGDVVVLLMWFYLSSFLLVLGAEINAESERQTVKDSTTAAAPLGQRGADASAALGPIAAESEQAKRQQSPSRPR